VGKIDCYYVPSSSCKVAPRVNEIKQRGKSKRRENREKKKKLIIFVFVVDLIWSDDECDIKTLLLFWKKWRKNEWVCCFRNANSNQNSFVHMQLVLNGDVYMFYQDLSIRAGGRQWPRTVKSIIYFSLFHKINIFLVNHLLSFLLYHLETKSFENQYSLIK